MSGRNRWLARCALVLVVPALVLGIVEACVRALGLGDVAPLVTLESDPQDSSRVHLRAHGISTDTPHVSPAFAREKAPGTFRIALFGESAAAGFPHHLSSTPARWLELLVRDRWQNLRAEVIDCAIAGIGGDWLEAGARLVLPLDVDAVLVYAGNNEFLSAFIERKRRAVTGSLGDRLRDFALSNSALARALRDRLGGSARLEPTRSPLDTRGLVETPLGVVREAIEADFEANLVAIGALAKERGIPFLLFRPVAARRDWPPLSSVPTRPRDEDERHELEQELEQIGLGLATGQLDLARQQLEYVAKIDPGLALLEFRRGELLDIESGVSGSPLAAPHYRAALDLDERPSRVNARLAKRIASAGAMVGATYIDADALFCEQSSDALPPASWLDDHVHLSIEGQYRLALVFMQSLERAGIPRPGSEWRPSAVREFAEGVNALGIALGEVVANQVQLGFSSLIAGYEQPATQVEHFARARRKFDSVLAEYPGQPRALCGRGFLNAAEGKPDQAIADFEAAYQVAARVTLEMRASVERIDVFRRALERSNLRFRNDGRLERVTPAR